jgi:hypothetical protein
MEIRFPQSTTEQFVIKPQLLDNLADHVKQATGLPEDSDLGVHWDWTQKVYRAFIEYEDQTGTVRQFEPVKFITNTRTGEDNWYHLVPRNTEHGVTYITTQELLLGSNHGLGWWDKFDNRHPDYGKPPILTTPIGEALAGGLFHIATTLGTTSLTVEGPTGMFQAIISAAAQGQTIPTEGIPADTTMEGINTTVMGNPQIQTTTDTTTDKGEKGALYGTLPPIFDRDKTKTKAFSLTVKAWRAVNWRKAVMRNPYTRTVLILNYIKGKNVDDWASHQFDLLLE